MTLNFYEVIPPTYLSDQRNATGNSSKLLGQARPAAPWSAATVQRRSAPCGFDRYKISVLGAFGMLFDGSASPGKPTTRCRTNGVSKRSVPGIALPVAGLGPSELVAS
jgi:hypothetical protein